jgi:hypothetical protein
MLSKRRQRFADIQDEFPTIHLSMVGSIQVLQYPILRDTCLTPLSGGHRVTLVAF